MSQKKKSVPYDKYNHSGVYSISILGNVVYVGRSKNMRKRILDHMRYIQKPEVVNKSSGPNKYYVLNEAYNEGLTIQFDTLYDGDDIVFQEAYYINKFRPALNMQIPNLDNPYVGKINNRARTITYKDLIDGEWQYIDDNLVEKVRQG